MNTNINKIDDFDVFSEYFDKFISDSGLCPYKSGDAKKLHKLIKHQLNINNIDFIEVTTRESEFSKITIIKYLSGKWPDVFIYTYVYNWG